MNQLAAPQDEDAGPAELVLPHKPESLADVVYETIREAIINRVIPPGSRLTEAALADQLNVSKTPVREALLKLRQIGLVEPSGRRGDASRCRRAVRFSTRTRHGGGSSRSRRRSSPSVAAALTSS